MIAKGYYLPPPVITLLTDFGLQDGYVAAMKGVILQICPDARLVDISHLVPPQDIRSAAFVLLTCYEYFPPGTIHLAVVDPGVGTERKAIAVHAGSHFFVGPDNGIFSLVLHKETTWEARSLENPAYWRMPLSETFHGRDLFAPVAAHLACSVSFDQLGPICNPLVPRWSTPTVHIGRIEGEVIHVDRFGNAITNVSRGLLEKRAPLRQWRVRTEKTAIDAISETYGQAHPGQALALSGSSGFIEIAVREGSAAAELEIIPGAIVLFEPK